MGLDPSWVHIVPYQALAAPGQSRSFEIRVRNLRRRAIRIEAVLVLPAGWRASPTRIKLSVAPGETGKAAVAVSIPAGWRGAQQRVAIAADVMADGRYLGQIAESVVDVRK
jgi:hypothetical protein